MKERKMTTPMDAYRKNTTQLGLVAMNIQAAPAHRELILNLADQLRVKYYAEVLDAKRSAETQALANKRTPLVDYSRSAVEARGRTAANMVDPDMVGKILTHMAEQHTLFRDTKYALEQADVVPTSDEAWGIIAATLNMHAFSYNAASKVLDLILMGKNPVFVL